MPKSSNPWQSAWPSGISEAIGGVEETAAKAVQPNAYPIKFASDVTASIGVSPTDKAYTYRTLLGARARVAAGPVGSDLTIQVQHFNGSAWATIATLTIADGTTTEATAAFNVVQNPGNLLRLNYGSVGSTTAATKISVDVLWSN